MNNPFRAFINKLVSRYKLHHVLFWATSYFILAIVFRVSGKPVKIDYIYSALLHLPLVAGVYFNLMILVPTLLRNKKMGFYAFAIVLLICAESGFYLVFFNSWVDVILPHYFFIAYLGFWDFSLLVLIYLASSTLFKIAKEWYYMMELETQNKTFELQALQQQLNPHFLFNTLNALYGMALKKHDNTPQAILKLSALMRYVLYESDTYKVPLNKEVLHIKDLVDLHKMRLKSNSESIKLEVETFDENLCIAPNLIVPLVENAMKHSLVTDFSRFFMHIGIHVAREKLFVRVANNLPDVQQSSKTGIGLKNLKRRLELLYNNDFEFFRVKKSDSFEVRLKIPVWKMQDT